jgi:hypoxanthine phosphoribosyltransferase
MLDRSAARILAEADLIVPNRSRRGGAARRRRDHRGLRDAHPLVLSVMGGAVIFTGQLLPLLASRWISTTCTSPATATPPPAASESGSSSRAPPLPAARCWWWMTSSTRASRWPPLKRRLLEQGAKDCPIAVFADKELGREKPVPADFVGVRLPNRYVFGLAWTSRAPGATCRRCMR